jgi:hypothetical protein
MFGLVSITPLFPAAQFLAVLPYFFLVAPPGLVFGNPHFQWTEFGFRLESGLGITLAVLFWIVVCLILAAITTLRTVAHENYHNGGDKDAV